MKLSITKKISQCFIILLFLNNTFKIYASDQLNIDFKQFKGRVFDDATNNTLESVQVFIENTNINTVTNKDGDFLLKVPAELLTKNVIISHLGYTKKIIPIAELNKDKNKIYLTATSITLADINIKTLKDSKGLVKEVFKKRGDNYLDAHSVMNAFYRETIKKKKKNLSLTEAIVNIHKTPYSSDKKDVLEFYKTRKKTNYSKLDTLAFKLQGGPFNTLLMDMVKYPEYIFSENVIDGYDFKFKGSTKIDDKLVYIIHFKSKSKNKSLLYQGELFIDYENKILTSASYELNLLNKKEAQSWFSIKKPLESDVTPTYAKYDLKYYEKDDKWYHGYSKMALKFKVNWKKRLFNSHYSMISEMAITNWKKKEAIVFPKIKDRIKSSIVMADYAVGFAEDNFWGQHNIIEPDKSIERAIKKIQKKLN